MADSEQLQDVEETKDGHSGTRKTVARAAAIAAASGATALAAKKAFGDRDSGGDDEDGARKQRRKSSSDDSVFSSVVSSAWDSARDSLVPMIEDAATHAGEYVGRHAPELVRETIVPRFIRGFERASESGDED